MLLFLLFFLALFEFYSMGILGMALICMIPVMILCVLFVFNYKISFFWIVFITNYLIMGLNRYYTIPLPLTTLTIMPQILLLIVCLLDIRGKSDAKYAKFAADVRKKAEAKYKSPSDRLDYMQKQLDSLFNYTY